MMEDDAGISNFFKSFSIISKNFNTKFKKIWNFFDLQCFLLVLTLCGSRKRFRRDSVDFFQAMYASHFTGKLSRSGAEFCVLRAFYAIDDIKPAECL